MPGTEVEERNRVRSGTRSHMSELGTLNFISQGLTRFRLAIKVSNYCKSEISEMVIILFSASTPGVVPSPYDSGRGRVTCFGKWNNYKYETRKAFGPRKNSEPRVSLRCQAVRSHQPTTCPLTPYQQICPAPLLRAPCLVPPTSSPP